MNRIKTLIARRDIIKSMIIKNLSDKYCGSFLGISWALLTPLLIMMVVAFVFTHIIKMQIERFPLFVLSALLPWFFFVNSICESTGSLRQNSNLIKQFVLPREIIPLSVVMAHFMNFFFGFIVLLPVFILASPAIVKCVFYLPLLLLCYLMFALGVSLLFSVIDVYFRDLAQMLNVGIMFWFWMTPIFYPLEMVPSAYRWLLVANPGTCYIVLFRSLLFHSQPGSFFMWLLAFGFAVLSFTVGATVFIRKEKDLVKYL